MRMNNLRTQDKNMRLLLLNLTCIIFALCACDRIDLKQKQDLSKIKMINARFNKGDYEYALTEASKYTTDYPNCEQGWCLLGWSHAKLDNLESSIECFNKAIALDPKSDNAFVGIGVARRKAGDLKGARQAYQEATRILPENAEAFSSLLVIEILERNYEAAVNYGEKAWALRKDLPSIPANLSVAYHYLKNEKKKRYYYQQAKRLGYHKLDALDKIFNGSLTVE